MSFHFGIKPVMLALLDPKAATAMSQMCHFAVLMASIERLFLISCAFRFERAVGFRGMLVKWLFTVGALFFELL